MRGNVFQPLPRAMRFWITEVMKTVLPARLRPVTASRMRFSFSAVPIERDAPPATLRAAVHARSPTPRGITETHKSSHMLILIIGKRKAVLHRSTSNADRLDAVA
jgi:hypothetical protein